MRRRGMGWKKDARDDRDFDYRPLKLGALPPKADLTSRFKFPIYDQGSLGSCTAQALAAVCLYNDVYDYDMPIVKPSRLFIYYNERRLEGTVNIDAGAMLRTGIKALLQWGYPNENIWPYKVTTFREKPPEVAYADALRERITTYQRIRTLADMKTCIAEGFPFVFGFYCFPSMFTSKVTRSGVIPMPKRGETEEGGHAVVGVGYDDATRRFKFRNSWGKNWGSGGYGYLPYDFIENPGLAMDFWTVRFNI